MSKKSRKPARKSAAPSGSFFAASVKWLFVAGLWAGIFVALLCAWYARELPDITKSATFERKLSIVVKAGDGSVAARYGEIIGNSVDMKDLPPCLPQAVMAIEDRRFYSHFGLDPIGLLRAVVVNLSSGHVAQGGSTITQQLAKNLFLSQERTLKRKIQEAMLALWLETTLTKDEIMTAYLNRVYLGTGAYGVDAAAKLYFHKQVGRLSLRECAVLAGMLKAPSRYNPLRNPGLSNERAQTVIEAMVDAGYITAGQAKKEIGAVPKPVEKPSSELVARYYTDWVVDQLADLIGTPDRDLVVETTLDPQIQGSIERAVNNVIAEAGQSKNISEGAMIVMRPDGEVLALVGGKNYNDSQFNRATQSRRPAGSSFKPIVYLTALERGWDTQDVLVDEPITEGKYRPKNFGGKYAGPVTLEQALTYSLNTISYQLVKAVGPGAVIDTARRMGITAELEPNLSIALGSNGVSLLEMTTAYAVIANGGHAVSPYAITKISSADGELLYQRASNESRVSTRVFRSSDIDNLTMMMQSVVKYGTGQGAYFGVPMAGKTGTSDESRDAMFMGFTDRLVGAAWLGNDDNSPMKNITGGSYPARIWREVMSQANGRYAPVNVITGNDSSSAFENMIQNLFTSGPQTPLEDSGAPAQAPPPERATPEDNRHEMRSLPESQRYND
jgi:penicillin-binding protein 1A